MSTSEATTTRQDPVIVHLRGGRTAVYYRARRVAGPFRTWAEARAAVSALVELRAVSA